MQLYFYLAVSFSLLVAVFAVQNAQPIAIKLLFWQLPQLPLAVIILGAALTGAIAALLFGLTGSLKNHKLRKELKEQIKSLEAELAKKQGPPKGDPLVGQRADEISSAQNSTAQTPSN